MSREPWWSRAWSDLDTNLSAIKPGLRIGVATGVLGFVGGGIYGHFRRPQAFPLAAAVGVQFLYYGSTITWLRGAMLAAKPGEHSRPTTVAASGVAGAISGAVASTWQRTTALKSGGVVGLTATAVQVGYHVLYNRFEKTPDRTPLMERIANTSWMPLKSVPDDEYEELLQGRISRLDAEIASVEQQLASLHQQKGLVSTGKP